MATQPLAAMSMGEILDGAFSIYRRILGTLIAIVMVCQGLPAALTVYAELAGGVIQNPSVWLAAMVVGWIGGLLSVGATVWAISEAYLGHTPAVGPALRYALGKAWRLFVAGLAKYLLIMVASLFLLIPGIIVACGYAVVTQSVLLEDLRRPTDSLARSWSLTKGYKLRAFSLGVVIFVILYIPIVVAGAAAGLVPETEAALAAVTVLSQILYLVLYPLVGCTFTLFYYDLRVRKEAFDLEHLARHLAPTART
jgi:hypothetical protein